MINVDSVQVTILKFFWNFCLIRDDCKMWESVWYYFFAPTIITSSILPLKIYCRNIVNISFFVVYSFFLRQYQCIIYIGLFFIQQHSRCTLMDKLLVFSQEQHILGRFLLFAYLLWIQNFRTLPPFCLLSCCLCLRPYSVGNEVNKVHFSPQWALIYIYLKAET